MQPPSPTCGSASSGGVRADGGEARRESRACARSTAIDKLLTGPFTAIPAFVAIMALVFWLTFNVVGRGCPSCWTRHLRAHGTWWRGACGGARERGAAVARHRRCVQRRGQRAQLPAHHRHSCSSSCRFLEDSGCMARVAFVMGQAAAAHRVVGTQHRSHAGGLAARCRRSWPTARCRPTRPQDDHIMWRRS
ncbi:MAG: hypothetical protein ACLSVD_09370 [Eggerthellaceae bacterium]